MTGLDISHAESADARQQPRPVRSLRATWRLLTFAVARLRRRRGLALLSASGAGLAVAMLVATLIVGAGVEDQSFRRSIASHPLGAFGQFERGNGFYVAAPIAKNALAAQRFVTARLRRAGLGFQAGAFIATSPREMVAMSDDLPANFRVVSGRLPRRCTPERCEYVQNVPGPGALGFIPAGGAPAPPAIRGYRFVKVGSVHQRGSSVLQLPPGPVPIMAGFSLITTGTARSGNGAMLWAAPAASVARHPWEVPHVIAAAARLSSDIERRLGDARVESQSASLEVARAQAASDGRRLLIVSGAILGVFAAFLIFAACWMRVDAELLYERLSVVNATPSQIRAVSVFEFLLASFAGAGAGIVLGTAAGALLVRHLGGDGALVARHMLALGTTWLYCVAAVALSIGALAVVSHVARAGRRSRVPELAAAVALAALLTGVATGRFDASGLGSAGSTTIAYVVLVPTLVALVVAVGGTRLVAPAFVVLERATRRLGPAARLAALSIARRPGDAAVLVGFAGAALGLAVFLQVYRATLVRSQHDQLLYAAPTGALISEDLRQLVPVNSIPLSRFPGQEKFPVLRASGGVPQLANGGAFTLIGISAAALPELAGWRDDFSKLSVAAIGQRLRPSFDPSYRATPLPRGRRIAIPIRSDGEPVDVAATLLSPNGTFTEVELGDTRTRSLHLNVPTAFRGGRLVGLVFRPTETGPEQSGQIGGFFDDVAVGSLRIGPVPWIDFGRFEGANGIDAHADGHTVSLRYAVGTKADARLRALQPTDGRLVPAVVSPALARAAGARSVLPLDVLGTQVLTRVVGIVRHFPTVDGDLVLADRETIATALDASEPGPPFYNEVWLNEPSEPRLQRQLETPVLASMDVIRRSSLAENARLSPVVRGAQDLLGLAVLVAVGLALLGVALAAASDVRARRWELLDLSAQGLDRRSLVRFARLRLLFSGAFAALLAVGLGLALAFVTVRLIRIAADIGAANPPVLTTVPWLALGGGAIAVVVAVVLLVNVFTAAHLRSLESSRT